MGHASYSQSFLGIIITLEEIQKAYLKFLKRFSEEEYNEKYNDLEDSPYYTFVEDVIKKYNLEYAEIGFQSEDELSTIVLCVYVWQQETEWMWGRNACGRIPTTCNFTEIQECITKKSKNLREFMDEFGLNEESHKLQMCGLVVGG